MNTMRKDIEYTHDDLTSEELEAEVAEALPERAAMSTINLTSLDPTAGAVEAVGDAPAADANASSIHAPPPDVGQNLPNEHSQAGEHSQVIAERESAASTIEPSGDAAAPTTDPPSDPVPTQETQTT